MIFGLGLHLNLQKVHKRFLLILTDNLLWRCFFGMAGEVVYFLLIEVDLIVIRLWLLLDVIPVEVPHH